MKTITNISACAIFIVSLHIASANNYPVNNEKNINTAYLELMEKGTTFIFNDELDSAIQYFSRAILIDSNNVEAYYALGYLYSLRCHQDTADCEMAIYFLNKSITKNRTYKNQHYNLAFCKMKQAKYFEALSEIKLAIKYEDADDEFYQLKAEIINYMYGSVNTW